MQPLDVTEGLESTLVMLGHKLRGGVTVVREYDADLPRDRRATPGELNQVWTNLIDNAVDAMDGDGTLRVVTRREPDAVVVEIGDTGPGMPPEVAARAFEAFFTTKDVGKGTGLGLDIARRIVVERHRGEIEIDSAPGRDGDAGPAALLRPGTPGDISHPRGCLAESAERYVSLVATKDHPATTAHPAVQRSLVGQGRSTRTTIALKLLMAASGVFFIGFVLTAHVRQPQGVRWPGRVRRVRPPPAHVRRRRSSRTPDCSGSSAWS